MARFWRCWGDLGIRMESLAGHITVAAGLRVKLGADDGFYQKVTQRLLNYLRSTAENGKHLSTPRLLAPIVGVQCGGDPTEYDYEKEASAL